MFTPFQTGFIQCDSTTYQLLNLYDSFCEAVDNGKEVRVVFFDITKAFDRVWHRGLVHKQTNKQTNFISPSYIHVKHKIHEIIANTK